MFNYNPTINALRQQSIEKVKRLKEKLQENHLEDMISQVYWTSVKPNGNGDIPISKALLGGKVFLAIKTKNVPNDSPLLVRIYEYNKVTKNKKLFHEDIVIRNNFGATKELYLEKSEKWLDLLKETGEDNELELFAEISGWGETVDKGKYLKIRNSDKVVVFFIGGAGDKKPYGGFAGPYNNILEVKKEFDKQITNKIYCSSYYIGFDDADIEFSKYQTQVRERIDKNVKIFIIGHSLGGWNGAHLSKVLSDFGFDIEMLITLDPVGTGLGVQLVSDLYSGEPNPSAKYWINILAKPKNPDFSDTIADTGGRWIINKGPNINAILDVNHAYALKMAKTKVYQNKSSLETLIERVKNIIGK